MAMMKKQAIAGLLGYQSELLRELKRTAKALGQLEESWDSRVGKRAGKGNGRRGKRGGKRVGRRRQMSKQASSRNTAPMASPKAPRKPKSRLSPEQEAKLDQAVLDTKKRAGEVVVAGKGAKAKAKKATSKSDTATKTAELIAEKRARAQRLREERAFWAGEQGMPA